MSWSDGGGCDEELPPLSPGLGFHLRAKNLGQATENKDERFFHLEEEMTSISSEHHVLSHFFRLKIGVMPDT